MKKNPTIAASLILALGILASTALAVALEASGWWVLAAPLMMTIAAGTAYLVAHPKQSGARKILPPALLGAGFLGAAAIAAINNPAQVAAMIPLLGSGAVVLLFPQPEC